MLFGESVKGTVRERDLVALHDLRLVAVTGEDVEDRLASRPPPTRAGHGRVGFLAQQLARGAGGSPQAVGDGQRDARVTAAMNVNVWDVGDDLKAIVGSRRPIDPARLADPDVALGNVVQ